MMFEWDEAKNRQNIARHGLRFEDARKIFDGFTVDRIDDRFDYGEERTISIGMLAGVAVLTVVHTDRDGVCRIISARPAKNNERTIYAAAIQQTLNA